jgi:release factor glutamine methyltransferase
MGVSIRNAIREADQLLAEAGVNDSRREAGLLLGHVLGRDRSFLITHSEDLLTAEQVKTFSALTSRRAHGEPLQYLTGHQEFFKLDFAVTPAVLIPRPETELLVETALELLRDNPEPFFADIGVGSGSISISLLHDRANARAVATDVSQAALSVAQVNAERHGVSHRLTLLESDCFDGVTPGTLFTLIVSNPPYIPDDELAELQREVRQEPQTALAGGPDGLRVIRRLLQEAPAFLISKGYLVFEIGFGQADAVNALLLSSKDWELIEIRNDLQSIPRTVVLRKK